jgi:hypothetical protein
VTVAVAIETVVSSEVILDWVSLGRVFSTVALSRVVVRSARGGEADDVVVLGKWQLTRCADFSGGASLIAEVGCRSDG